MGDRIGLLVNVSLAWTRELVLLVVSYAEKRTQVILTGVLHDLSRMILLWTHSGG